MASKESTPIALADLHTIADLAAAFPNKLTVSAIRWQLRHRDENGLGNACVRVGKRLLISQTRYEQWLGSKAGQ